MTKIVELYGKPTDQSYPWPDIVSGQQCPLLDRKYLKNRKSEPAVSIGTCTVSYGREARNIIICPFRLLERSQIFIGCLHLLALHEPGNELRIDRNSRYPAAALTTALSPYDPVKLSTLLVLNCKHLIPLAPSGQNASDSFKATGSL